MVPAGIQELHNVLKGNRGGLVSLYTAVGRVRDGLGNCIPDEV